jgi:pantoate--beta-alanine ligase
MQEIETVSALRALPREGVVGLVPTMGALHDGHVALLRAARAECDTVVASIFVNPAQFGDPADLESYPRDLAGDAEIAAAEGVDVLFAPSADELYPDGFATWVDPEGAATGLESDHRPGHFRGVATVCVKLFAAVEPHLAFFGQKDAQQVAVIKRVVRDLNLDLEIHVVPIVRDADGLALSSRNARLTKDDRLRALALPRALEAGLEAYRRQEDPISAARAVLKGLDVDYVAVADFDGQPTLAIAARAGRTRLIDNVVLTRK